MKFSVITVILTEEYNLDRYSTRAVLYAYSNRSMNILI